MNIFWIVQVVLLVLTAAALIVVVMGVGCGWFYQKLTEREADDRGLPWMFGLALAFVIQVDVLSVAIVMFHG